MAEIDARSRSHFASSASNLGDGPCDRHPDQRRSAGGSRPAGRHGPRWAVYRHCGSDGRGSRGGTTGRQTVPTPPPCSACGRSQAGGRRRRNPARSAERSQPGSARSRAGRAPAPRRGQVCGRCDSRRAARRFGFGLRTVAKLLTFFDAEAGTARKPSKWPA